MSAPAPLIGPPHAAPWLAPYWEGLQRHEFRLPRCSVCGRWEWYPTSDRPACADSHYLWQTLGPHATIFTYTRVERPLLPDVRQAYWVGLVTFDEAPNCRIACRLEPGSAAIAIGSRVRLAFSGEGDQSFPYFITEVTL